jgi:hypothetical protein
MRKQVNVMTSENGENQGYTPEKILEPKKRSFKLFLISVFVITIVVLSVFAFIFWNPNEGFSGDDKTETEDWYFQGAYANYEGSTSYLFMNINFSMRFEVVDFNSTHVKTLYDMKLKSDSLGTLLTEQDTKWAPVENLGTFAWEEMEGYVPGAEYEDHVYIEGLGTKFCKIYEFVQADTESGNMNIKVYADPEIECPLKIKFDITLENDQSIILDINMKDTNISELI